MTRSRSEEKRPHAAPPGHSPRTPAPGGRPRPEGARERRRFLLWVLAGLLAFGLAQTLRAQNAPEEIPFSRFLSLVDQGQVLEANVGAGPVTGVIKTADGNESFETVLPPSYETNQLVETLREKGAKVSATRANPLPGLLISSLLPLALLGGVYYLITRRARQNLGGGALSFGKGKAKLYDRTDMRTTFADVAGVDEVEEELAEVVDYLKNPRRYQKIGARIPKGVLLVGPPGTGKTLLARAVAGEAETPFFYISASEFIELFVGLGAARVRDLFAQARERAPAIIFIDEIDAIGQARGGASGAQLGSHQEQQQTLQQLLTEMDGFEPNSGVIIMAASNRPEVLDQALLRPGRFDRQILVNLPDKGGREEILAIHAKNVIREEGVDLQVIARRTPGFSGAQLANVINEGALLAARRGKTRVGMAELEEAVNRVVAGLERKSQVLTEEDRRFVAYHELGHALVAYFLPNTDPVHRVSIIPRGIGALGYTQQLPEEERYLLSEPELRDRIAVLLGGRVAEELVFGFPTTGAYDDLQKATEIARRMVVEFGMSERLGPVNLAEPKPLFLGAGASTRPEGVSDETEMTIDREIKAIILEAGRKARKILDDHRDDLEALAAQLLERETLERGDLEAHFGQEPKRPVRLVGGPPG